VNLSNKKFLESSIKVEVKKKHSSIGWIFSCFAAHLIERESVLTFRAMGSVSRDCAPVVWVFSTSGFSSLVRDEACQFRNQKAERWSGANHSSI
jgi:hypothetical protein